ncbi:MAG: hypothetical protein C3F11_04820 [Methylocystaceae bacterium]|nr:MAG: hypothetical protein C3F11_04820 [Methylocystaceae bacterium]
MHLVFPASFCDRQFCACATVVAAMRTTVADRSFLIGFLPMEDAAGTACSRGFIARRERVKMAEQR